MLCWLPSPKHHSDHCTTPHSAFLLTLVQAKTFRPIWQAPRTPSIQALPAIPKLHLMGFIQCPFHGLLHACSCWNVIPIGGRSNKRIFSFNISPPLLWSLRGALNFAGKPCTTLVNLVWAAICVFSLAPSIWQHTKYSMLPCYCFISKDAWMDGAQLVLPLILSFQLWSQEQSHSFLSFCSVTFSKMRHLHIYTDRNVCFSLWRLWRKAQPGALVEDPTAPAGLLRVELHQLISLPRLQ